ncbi:MAG: hypothetical protein ACE5GS_05815 [Kiloniellaceae bacterium]
MSPSTVVFPIDLAALPQREDEILERFYGGDGEVWVFELAPDEALAPGALAVTRGVAEALMERRLIFSYGACGLVGSAAGREAWRRRRAREAAR